MKAGPKSILNMKGIIILLFVSLISISLVQSCSSDTELPPDVEKAMANLPEKIDYNLDVKPILSDRCFACHGPDKNKQKGGLRLDIKDAAYDKVTESGLKALVPGNLTESEVFQRIISKDPEVMMPTPQSNLSLTAEDKAVLIKWIKGGAEYKPHWSLVPPEDKEIPEVKNKAWVKNQIDNFVLVKLEEKGLKLNAEASKETLIRRVSFDLTGLPPTVEEVDTFLKDRSPNAYEKLVDRLLKSPHYGERMAVDWLDASRYADTHGYQDDGMRNAYPWRDWVISAYNRNLPFDKFVTWQLAGDLLPNPTREQLVATCFLRNHPQSQEGGIVDEEYRVEYVADRVNTFGKAFLAMSTECARCHDHKYDPITNKNYYELFAFFNSNNESGEIPYSGEASPTVILTKPQTEKILHYIKNTEIKPLEKKQANANLYKGDFDKWLSNKTNLPDSLKEVKQGLIGYFTFDEKEPKNSLKTPLSAALAGVEDNVRPVPIKAKFGSGLRLNGDMSINFNEHLNFEKNQPFSLSLWVNILKKAEKGPIFSRTNGELDNWRGYTCDLNKDGTLTIKFTHVYPANGIVLNSVNKFPYQKWTHLALTYDGSSKASGIKVFINGKAFPLKVETDNLNQSLMNAKDGANWGVQPFRLGQSGNKTMSNVAYDDFKAFKRELSVLEVNQLAGKDRLISKFLSIPNAGLSGTAKKLVFEYYLKAVDRQYEQVLQKLAEVRKKETDTLTNQEEVMTYKELKRPRPSFILNRGVYDAPKERVYPNTPESMFPFPKDFPRNRLGLAKWLTDEKQPLFSRVMVNRFWQQCFGQGLVKTAEDFGNQGNLPTHPELLDWLAYTFRTKGWNVKELMKTIVTSATYRQSSIPTLVNKEKDPDNILLTRASSYRMSAEMVRDNALRSSGLLVEKVGGKSAYPYQPAGLWEALATRNVTSYPQSHGEGLYRRSLYTVWKRSSPHPAMINFDVPDRYACTVRRQKTSTPLQSLVLLNDVQYVEAARVLAEKMIKRGGETTEGRLTYGFRALTSRHPRKEEIKILLSLYNEQYADYSKNPGKAEQLLKEGEYPVDTSLNKVELASCAIVASALMNFDEFIIKR